MLRYAHVPVKQAVIAASALSLIYPQDGIDGYPREAFLADLVREAAADIRGALDKGAHSVQIDFTEGRLAVKLDPTGQSADVIAAIGHLPVDDRAHRVTICKLAADAEPGHHRARLRCHLPEALSGIEAAHRPGNPVPAAPR